MNDQQPTPILGAIPVGGRLSCWLDRGMQILYRCGVVCFRKRQKQILCTHMLARTLHACANGAAATSMRLLAYG